MFLEEASVSVIEFEPQSFGRSWMLCCCYRFAYPEISYIVSLCIKPIKSFPINSIVSATSCFNSIFGEGKALNKVQTNRLHSRWQKPSKEITQYLMHSGKLWYCRLCILSALKAFKYIG